MLLFLVKIEFDLDYLEKIMFYEISPKTGKWVPLSLAYCAMSFRAA